MHRCNSSPWVCMTVTTIDCCRDRTLTPYVYIRLLSERVPPWARLPWWQISCCITIEPHLISRVFKIWLRHECIRFRWFVWSEGRRLSFSRFCCHRSLQKFRHSPWFNWLVGCRLKLASRLGYSRAWQRLLSWSEQCDSAALEIIGRSRRGIPAVLYRQFTQSFITIHLSIGGRFRVNHALLNCSQHSSRRWVAIVRSVRSHGVVLAKPDPLTIIIPAAQRKLQMTRHFNFTICCPS